MSTGETITVAVPVYRGEQFLEETLRSIQAQTHREIRVLISVDGPDPNCEAISERFLADRRFELFVQPQNLGWVGNINWLMTKAESPFWCLQQQDDLMAPQYLEALLAYARSAPEAVQVYGDIEAFGSQRWILAQPSVTGPPTARQLALLHAHHPAAPFRALTRTEGLREGGGIPTNEMENYSADTTWMSVMARVGELHRVPVQMYRKRYHPGNEHMRWYAWPVEKRARAWMIHCADMLEQAMLVEATPQDYRLFWLATVARLNPRWKSGYARLEDESLSYVGTFFTYMKEKRRIDLPFLLKLDWSEIEDLALNFYWHPNVLQRQWRKARRPLGAIKEKLRRLLKG